MFREATPHGGWLRKVFILRNIGIWEGGAVHQGHEVPVPIFLNSLETKHIPWLRSRGGSERSDRPLGEDWWSARRGLTVRSERT